MSSDGRKLSGVVRCKGVAVVPGIACGPLWSPAAALASDGTFDDFERARERFIRGASSLPEELRVVYEGLAADPLWEEGIRARLARGRSLADAIRVETGREAGAQLADLADPYLRATMSWVIFSASNLASIALERGESEAPRLCLPGRMTLSASGSKGMTRHNGTTD